jgi:hypothetical protein
MIPKYETTKGIRSALASHILQFLSHFQNLKIISL